MIRIIKAHNELNGILFATIEFGLMALFLIPFGVYCLAAQSYGVGLVLGGIGLNCLPVVYYGLRAIWAGELGHASIWDSRVRERLIAENPHMLRDTLALSGATLVPLLVLALVGIEAYQAGKRADG